MSRLGKLSALIFMAGAVALATSTMASASTAGVVRGGHVSGAAALAARSGNASSDIRVLSCAGNLVEVVQTNGTNICFGFTGITGYMSLDAYSMLPGNNYGQVWFNYGYKNYVGCFGSWPSGEECYSSNGTSCNQCGSYAWGVYPYYYAIINYIKIYGWN